MFLFMFNAIYVNVIDCSFVGWIMECLLFCFDCIGIVVVIVKLINCLSPGISFRFINNENILVLLDKNYLHTDK